MPNVQDETTYLKFQGIVTERSSTVLKFLFKERELYLII